MYEISNINLEAVDSETAKSLDEDLETMLFNYTILLCTIGYFKDVKTWAIIDLAAFYTTGQMESFNNLYESVLNGNRILFGPIKEFHMAFYDYYLLENQSLFIYLYKWFTWAFNAYQGNQQKIATEFLKLTRGPGVGAHKRPINDPTKNKICDLIILCQDP